MGLIILSGLRLFFKLSKAKQLSLTPEDKNFPIRYVDNLGNQTEDYPFNPNGSKGGKAAIVSDNGRHLAIMPHPERSFLRWQLPYDNIAAEGDDYTAWFKMFY